MGLLERSLILFCLSKKSAMSKEDLAKLLYRIDENWPVLSYEWIMLDKDKPWAEELHDDLEWLEEAKLVKSDDQKKINITDQARELINSLTKTKMSIIPKVEPIIDNCLLNI